MITLEKVRELAIEPLSKNRPAYVYAASGLVRLGNSIFIVADDELHLAEFDVAGSVPGKWLRLLPGVLPLDYEERKKAKPDLETITRLNPYEYAPEGALLVVPSLSRPGRIKGVVLTLDKNEKVAEQAIPIDFSEIRNKLIKSIDGLNIEGIAVQEKSTRLFHRGSKKKGKSVAVELDTKSFLRDLHDTHVPKAESIISMKEYDLGDINGVMLAFTDAVPMPDGRIVFLASAEATDDEYTDGATLGSSLGIMNEKGEVEQMIRIEGREKFEGVCADYAVKNADSKSTRIDFFVVSDTDNEKVPSNLYRGMFNLN